MQDRKDIPFDVHQNSYYAIEDVIEMGWCISTVSFHDINKEEEDQWSCFEYKKVEETSLNFKIPLEMILFKLEVECQVTDQQPSCQDYVLEGAEIMKPWGYPNT